MRKISSALLMLLLGFNVSAHADDITAKEFARKYAIVAKTINPDYKGGQPDQGRAFFTREYLVKGKTVACASCHTDNPANPGKNSITGKKIEPLSPLVNGKRFTDIDKVEKNFTKHCNDILARDCTAEEKVNYIAYLLTVDVDKSGNVVPAK